MILLTSALFKTEFVRDSTKGRPVARVLFFRGFSVSTNCIRPEKHDSGPFSDTFNFGSDLLSHVTTKNCKNAKKNEC